MIGKKKKKIQPIDPIYTNILFQMDFPTTQQPSYTNSVSEVTTMTGYEYVTISMLVSKLNEIIERLNK